MVSPRSAFVSDSETNVPAAERSSAVTPSPVMVAVSIATSNALVMNVTWTLSCVPLLVAGIVKLDDIGNWLQGKSSAAARSVGRGLILLMPWFMRALAVVGMLAMFLVGGGIIVHGLAPVSEFLHAHHWENGLPGMLASLVVGLVTGALVCAVVLPLMKLFNKSAAAAH